MVETAVCFHDGVEDRTLNRNRTDRTDVSRNAMAVARMLDRNVRAPGTYVITVRVDAYGTPTWTIEVARVERLQVSAPASG